MKARALSLALIVTVSVALGIGSAWAAQLTATEIQAGDPLSSAAMNAIFDEVEVAVNDNDARITTNEGNIGNNTTDIATNATAIGNNTADIATNATAIGNNTTGIAANATAIGTNATDIATLQGQVADLLARVAVLEAALLAYQNSNVAALETYLTVNEVDTLRGVAPPNVILEGVNLHVRNASATQTVDGRGNLIIGHNENLAGGPVVGRGGSHNIVVGGENEFSSAAGIVAGWRNTISALFATVTGGAVNAAADVYSSVSGGNRNLANGPLAVVSGGENNAALGGFSVVGGGELNTAQDAASTVGGGLGLTATGTNAYVDPDSP